MSFRFLKISVLMTFVIAIAGLIACGDTSTSGETTALDPIDSRGFYPFDEAPVLISFEQPEYPGQAKKAGLEGDVAVKVLVGIDGTVERVTVLSATDPVFEAAASDAASLCRFTPAKLEGKPTKAQVMIPFQFRLES